MNVSENFVQNIICKSAVTNCLKKMKIRIKYEL